MLLTCIINYRPSSLLYDKKTGKVMFLDRTLNNIPSRIGINMDTGVISNEKEEPFGKVLSDSLEALKAVM